MLIRDRLGSLRARCGNQEDINGRRSSLPRDRALWNFLRQVDCVRAAVRDLELALLVLQRLNNKALATPLDATQIQEQRNKAVAEVKLRALNAKGQLAQLTSCESGPNRLRRFLIAAEGRRLKLAIRACHEEDEAFVNRCKARLRHQYLHVGRERTDEELEEIISAGLNSACAYTEKGETFECLSLDEKDETENLEHFVRLEQQLTELNDIFLDMAATVELQGNMVKDIETHVHAAEDATNSGVRRMQRAEHDLLSRRCKKANASVSCALWKRSFLGPFPETLPSFTHSSVVVVAP
ncbi:unnamed protein product [Notodromas monacha]|uniref:t-SNARE coiled-coil homology domain-containing protein n=1 Tax=Notodromas monacha TaxID=399045 RepID=A0A7R9GE36_9CRUS|nr:unnamed protein product [Notodromas monacha]CAG0917482.1 unnamed protein product [Notodromas monacha]